MEPDLLRPSLRILARAVVRQSSTILLARAEGCANSFLPGGHHESGESLKVSLARELREELGLEVQVGTYLGAVEHTWEDGAGTNYEINHLFGVSLPTLRRLDTVASREAHLTFFWIELSELTKHQLEPHPRQYLLGNLSIKPSALWASTVQNGASRE